MENIIRCMTQDFEMLADEHEAEAKNERIWARGALNDAESVMHEENADTHQLLARMYRRMAGDTLAFVEAYYDIAEV
jgi:hypothetical protein